MTPEAIPNLEGLTQQLREAGVDVEKLTRGLNHLAAAPSETERMQTSTSLPQGGIALAAGVRVVARLEQVHQGGGDARMGVQRALHVGLAEGGARLAQEFRVETQYRDLPRRQAGRQDETVEPVILDPPCPHFDERRFKARQG